MKYHEPHFDKYITENNNYNLHPKLKSTFDTFPEKLACLPNMIFYGPSGVGKYTQMLCAIKKYSPSKLKYEKKISVIFNTQQYFFKISDIHFEVDMALLGCNSKLLWHDIYQQIIDVLSTKQDKSGIIVCKNFHDIQNELLLNFYSYMQTNNNLSVCVKFILITNEISFIYENILNCCRVINIPRPTKTNYTNHTNQKLPKTLQLENITNIKLLTIEDQQHTNFFKIILSKIINSIIDYKTIQYSVLRDNIYDIFIYNLDMYTSIWYILTTLISDRKIERRHISEVMVKTYLFLKYYNNNYRPIYHVEKYILYLIKIIHNI